MRREHPPCGRPARWSRPRAWKVQLLMYAKAIVYDPETRDFALYLNQELVGFARTYQDADKILDELIYELLRRHSVREAA